MFKLNTKFDTDSLLYLLHHFECDSHTVHMLPQQRLPPPLSSTVKSSLFTHACSSPLFLAARLHQVTQTFLVILTMAGLFLDKPQYKLFCLFPPLALQKNKASNSIRTCVSFIHRQLLITVPTIS